MTYEEIELRNRTPEGQEYPDVPARVRLWPQRKRCYRCRGYFGFVVVDRLYCSWMCAGRPSPAPIRHPRVPPPGMPRQCTNAGGRRYKVRYRSIQEAEDYIAMATESGLNAYQCEHCLMFHVGHVPRPKGSPPLPRRKPWYQREWATAHG